MARRFTMALSRRSSAAPSSPGPSSLISGDDDAYQDSLADSVADTVTSEDQTDQDEFNPEDLDDDNIDLEIKVQQVKEDAEDSLKSAALKRAWRTVIWSYCDEGLPWDFPAWALDKFGEEVVLNCLRAEFGEKSMRRTWQLHQQGKTVERLRVLLDVQFPDTLALWFGADRFRCPTMETFGKVLKLFGSTTTAGSADAAEEAKERFIATDYALVLLNYARRLGMDTSTRKGRHRLILARYPLAGTVDKNRKHRIAPKDLPKGVSWPADLAEVDRGASQKPRRAKRSATAAANNDADALGNPTTKDNQSSRPQPSHSPPPGPPQSGAQPSSTQPSGGQPSSAAPSRRGPEVDWDPEEDTVVPADESEMTGTGTRQTDLWETASTPNSPRTHSDTPAIRAAAIEKDPSGGTSTLNTASTASTASNIPVIWIPASGKRSSHATSTLDSPFVRPDQSDTPPGLTTAPKPTRDAPRPVATVSPESPGPMATATPLGDRPDTPQQATTAPQRPLDDTPAPGYPIPPALTSTPNPTTVAHQTMATARPQQVSPVTPQQSTTASKRSLEDSSAPVCSKRQRNTTEDDARHSGEAPETSPTADALSVPQDANVGLTVDVIHMFIEWFASARAHCAARYAASPLGADYDHGAPHLDSIRIVPNGKLVESIVFCLSKTMPENLWTIVWVDTTKLEATSLDPFALASTAQCAKSGIDTLMVSLSLPPVEVTVLPLATQDNANDCGVFTLVTALTMVLSRPPPTNIYPRAWMSVFHSIVSSITLSASWHPKIRTAVEDYDWDDLRPLERPEGLTPLGRVEYATGSAAREMEAFRKSYTRRLRHIEELIKSITTDTEPMLKALGEAATSQGAEEKQKERDLVEEVAQYEDMMRKARSLKWPGTSTITALEEDLASVNVHLKITSRRVRKAEEIACRVEGLQITQALDDLATAAKGYQELISRLDEIEGRRSGSVNVW